ncbi:MAG: bifunctional precorrin-2 dehydrogenase/sirohydrochlorin ferrochelatase [Magnetococcales bacterium]|nr:bifunctional precorrin-2 dehydrogenase/sirohydrochlorin ferrochelatase [Magnetococcales bacterium]
MAHDSMPHYMAELVLADRPVLVVGGGRVARRKIEGLLVTGARVTVVAPHLDPVVAEWAVSGRIEHLPGKFSLLLLDRPPRPLLVFAATDQAELNRSIGALCQEYGLLCNSADDPESSGFLVPAVVRRGEVTVAVGSGGRSPALMRVLKERLDAWLEPGWGELAALFGRWRGPIQTRITDPETRQNFWRATALEAVRDPLGPPLRGDAEAWFAEQVRKQGESF